MCNNWKTSDAGHTDQLSFSNTMCVFVYFQHCIQTDFEVLLLFQSGPVGNNKKHSPKSNV